MNLFFCAVTDTYLTFGKPAEGLFRDRNSRFLAFAYRVETVSQVNDLLASLRKKYHDARHHCYAYRINPEKEQYRINDDGEPAGTAGKPIYNQLVSKNLHNALIVVVRYFGGTLLGKGGLINAYKSASMDVINKAELTTMYLENRYRLTFTYEKVNEVLKIVKDENLTMIDAVYEMECIVTIGIRKGASGQILSKLMAIENIRTELLQSD